MVIDLKTFENHKKFVISWFHTKGGDDVGRTIAIMAGSMFIPAIVIAYWLGEETNWNEDSVTSVKRLISFYRYTKIYNKPENSPI